MSNAAHDRHLAPRGLITVCGLIALITPVVLWTAWSTIAFYALLAAGCGAILAIYLLIALSPDEDF